MNELEIYSGKVAARPKVIIEEQDYRKILLSYRKRLNKTRQELVEEIYEQAIKISKLEEIIDVVKFNVGLERRKAVEEFSKLLLSNFKEDESYTLIDRATVVGIKKAVLKEEDNQ